MSQKDIDKAESRSDLAFVDDKKRVSSGAFTNDVLVLVVEILQSHVTTLNSDESS